MTSPIISLKEVQQEETIRTSLKEMSKEDLEERFVRLLSINTAAAARVDALEDELQLLRGLLERERQINKAVKRRKKGKKIKPDVQWYELVDALNPDNYTRLPLEGQVFILGHIDDILVVEVPAEATEQEIFQFRKGLESLGMTSAAVIIKEGVRFLKLKSATLEQREKISAHLKELENVSPEEKTEASSEEKTEASSEEKTEASSEEKTKEEGEAT